MKFKIKPKKAQSWGTDLAVAFMIFAGGILFFYFYSFNYSTDAEDLLETLIHNGNFIADSLLSEGSPVNWDSSNVAKIGLITNGKINQTKINEFSEIIQSDYERTKVLFNTKYDYYFFIEGNLTVYGVEVDGLGKPGVNRTNIDSQSLIKVTRFTIYENKPVTVNVYVFE